MIKVILDMLKDAKGETENIRIAMGKNKLSTTVKDALNELKLEKICRSK